MYDLLKTISSPEDVKRLKIDELNELSSDIREALFNRLTKVGGHFGPNFGVVELTIALHYVFNSPVDKFVFDVSHQSYTHKMLTGRRSGYIDDECFKNDSGYTNPEESEHDLFNVGHTSTSISLATGLAKGRDLLGGKENVIAIIGDGSLSGGEALEGLNVAGSEINSNLIIIVNDNQQSISETHGGLYKSLEALRETNGKSDMNIFTAMGLDYIYEPNGNDIASLISLLKKVKDINHPIVVHINTQKGKGYKLAEVNKEAWHWTVPFDRETGKPKFTSSDESYVQIAKEHMIKKAKEDEKVVIITPNMPGSFGLSIKERQDLGDKFVDVGIAEEQAVAMASGVAKRGCKPIVVTNVTFMQRTYDQISHDVALNNSPVTFILNFAHFDGLTDATHLGIFGLSMFTNIPNLLVIAPGTAEEVIEAIDFSLSQRDNPVVILMPGNKVVHRKSIKPISDINKYEVTRKGEEVAIIALGDFYQKGEALADSLQVEGINATLINPRYADVDEETLNELKNYKLVITLEDGVAEGGFGYKVANYLSDSEVKVKCFGLKKKFYDRYNPNDLLKELGMDIDSLVKYVRRMLGK